MTDPRQGDPPAAGATGGPTTSADGALTSVARTHDISGQARAELELLGCLLHADAEQAAEIARAVPADVFTDPLTRVAYSAAEQLAGHGAPVTPPDVVAVVVHAGLWPRDLHHEVTGRVIDAYTDCLFPSAWRVAAAQLLDAHAVRVTSAKLAQAAALLREGHLRDVAAQLHDAAEFLELVAGWSGHVRREGLGVVA